MRSFAIGFCCIFLAVLLLAGGLLTAEKGLRELLGDQRPPGVLGFERISSGAAAITFAGRTVVVNPLVWAGQAAEWRDRLLHFFWREP